MKKLLFLAFFTASATFLSAQITPPPPKLDTAKLAEYVGDYAFDGAVSACTVTQKDGFLYGEVDSYGNNKLLLQPETDTFKSTSSYGTIYVFKRGPDQKVTALTIKVMGQELTGNKKKK